MISKYHICIYTYLYIISNIFIYSINVLLFYSYYYIAPFRRPDILCGALSNSPAPPPLKY